MGGSTYLLPFLFSSSKRCPKPLANPGRTRTCPRLILIPPRWFSDDSRFLLGGCRPGAHHPVVRKPAAMALMESNKSGSMAAASLVFSCSRTSPPAKPPALPFSAPLPPNSLRSLPAPELVNRPKLRRVPCARGFRKCSTRSVSDCS